jgi:hypothetical protein
MGITDQIKNKLHSHSHDKWVQKRCRCQNQADALFARSESRPDDSEIQAALQHEANAQTIREPETGAGAGVAIESFGGGPRFDNSGPGPQVQDFHGSNAQPQNPVVSLPQSMRWERN